MRLTLLFLLFAPVSHADPKPPPEPKKAVELVGQLGNARFAVREAAAKQLLEMGEHAFAALIEGTKSTDEEVRTRSAVLLPHARAAIWKTRTNAYLADTESKQKHDLPLLAEFEKAVGKDPRSRKLFAEMIREKGVLIEQAAKDPRAAQDELFSRCKEIADTRLSGSQQAKAPLGELAALYFVHARLHPLSRSWDEGDQPAILIWNPTMMDEIEDKEVGPPLRRLLAYWSENRPVDDLVSQQMYALLGRDKSIPEARAALIRLAIQESPGTGLMIRTPAVQALGAIGDQKAIAVLNKLVKDESVLFTQQADLGGATFTLGDQALLALITASKKRAEDYGFTQSMVFAFQVAPNMVTNVSLRGFPSEAARSDTQKKWRDETAKK